MSPLASTEIWGGLILGVTVAVCFVAEHRRPLRARRRPLPERLAANVPMVAVAALTLRLVMIPAALAAAAGAERAGVGVLRWLPMSAVTGTVAGFLLLDWSVYVWHRLNHRLPWLWRFHLVHHTDLDLDVTTAFRFHVGELLLSVGWRGLAIAVIGAGPALLLGYEVAAQAATAFHHSNWALPAALERALNVVLVTPSMHGIHHSVVEREANSNWSVILSCWDRLHATFRRDPPNATLTIGLPAWPRPSELGVASLLALPFRRQPSAWIPR